MIAALLYGLNHARLWRRSVPVWNRQVRAPSFDRLLFLGLHRVGWMGSQEVEMLRRLVRPGMAVVDVGANVGLYSLLLAGWVGETGCVYSFEPEPGLCDTLRENCALNGATNIVPFQFAAGAVSGRASFQRSIFNSGNNSLGGDESHAVSVDVVRIDDILRAQKIDLVKIDVQGHEFGALMGMERLLSSNPGVRIFFEFWPAGLQRAGSSPEALLNFFQTRGFMIFSTENAEPRELMELPKLIQQLRPRGYTNLLASRTAFASHE